MARRGLGACSANGSTATNPAFVFPGSADFVLDKHNVRDKCTAMPYLKLSRTAASSPRPNALAVAQFCPAPLVKPRPAQ